jgi:hypothetical protein
MPEMIDTESPMQKYLQAISEYENTFKKWEARTTKLIKRYRDDTRSNSSNQTAKFNILWSNVQTLVPAVYAKLPKCDVSRRFSDNDPVGRVASLLLERSIDFEIEHYPDFRATMKHAVEDRFLGGRGVAWVRYEPHVRAQETDEPDDGVQVTEDVDDDDDPTEVPEEIDYECAPTDYVHWKDFGHTAARTWEEVTAVWRWVYMNKNALVERFGEEKADKIPMDAAPEPLDGRYPKKENNQAKICELWDLETKKAYWFTKESKEFIDEREDPLELEGFFPCAKPLYATTTSDSLVPVPDFVLYQDQAAELDILSDRIDGLVKALRVRGVYDSSVPALQRLLTEGDNNSLIPVETWTAFSEKNGLKGSIDLLPLDMLVTALTQCYAAHNEVIQQIYAITGISDIIRGQTEASETATAQQIKGQYAGLRLRSMQEDVALFATSLLRLKAQVICTKFQPETILQYAAAQQLSPEDQQVIPQAMQLLKDRPLRNFRIDVAADSLVQIDEAQEKQDRMEFIQAFGGFLKEAVPAAQATPDLGPILIEVMKYGIGAFKQARQIEGALDAGLDKMNQAQKQKAMNPQAAPPNPEMEKIKADQQQAQQQMMADQQKAQMQMHMDQQAEQMRVQADQQIESMRMQHEAQLEQMRSQIESRDKARDAIMEQNFAKWKAELDAATSITTAEIAAKASMANAATAAENKVTQDLAQ